MEMPGAPQIPKKDSEKTDKVRTGHSRDNADKAVLSGVGDGSAMLSLCSKSKSTMADAHSVQV